MQKNINKNLFYLILISILITIFLKLFMYDILPAKYFYDSNHILNLISGKTNLTDISYSYASNLFKSLNIFHLTTIKQWGYIITFIFMPIIIYNISKKQKYNYKQIVFIISSIVLLNIYVLGLSKDIIQFVFFSLIYLIIKNEKLNDLTKLILTCAVLLYESLNFRVYYAIMAMLIVSIYYIYNYIIKEQENNQKNKYLKIIIFTLIVFFVEVFVVQLFSTNNYDAILNARYSVNIWRTNSIDANTIINDLLGKNTNYLLFIFNYIINLIRIMFPIELIFKGPKQIIFMMYQIYISYNLIKSCKNINKKNCLWIFVFISYIMISTIFEPDFGSFIRHETSSFLILLELIIINDKGVQNG